MELDPLTVRCILARKYEKRRCREYLHLDLISGGLWLQQIPGYYASLLIYYIVGKVATWMSSQQVENTEESSARELKRQAKKERKAARGPKVRVR